MKLTNIILLALIALFVWLWLSKPSEPNITLNNDVILLEELKIAQYKLMQSDTIIDSLQKEIIKSSKARFRIESTLKSLIYAYEKQIEDIINNPIDSDIELFRAEFARSEDNKR